MFSTSASDTVNCLSIRYLAQKSRECYVEVCDYLVKNKVSCTIHSNAVLFNITPLAQNTVYDLDEIITKSGLFIVDQNALHYRVANHINETDPDIIPGLCENTDTSRMRLDNKGKYQ